MYKKLTEEEVKTIALKFYKKREAFCTKSNSPKVVLIGAQAGAGKSGIAKRIKKEMKNQGGYIHIDADRMRELNPNGEGYPSEVTQTDAGRIVTELRKIALSNGKNCMEEGTFRDHKSINNFINRLRENNVSVELVALSVPKEESILGVFSRYENQIANKSKNPRFVNPDYHEEAFNGFKNTVKELEGKFDRVRVVSRQGETLFDSLENKNGITAYEALIENQKFPENKIEKHLEHWESLQKKAIERKADESYLNELNLVKEKTLTMKKQTQRKTKGKGGITL